MTTQVRIKESGSGGDLQNEQSYLSGDGLPESPSDTLFSGRLTKQEMNANV